MKARIVLILLAVSGCAGPAPVHMTACERANRAVGRHNAWAAFVYPAVLPLTALGVFHRVDGPAPFDRLEVRPRCG